MSILTRITRITLAGMLGLHLLTFSFAAPLSAATPYSNPSILITELQTGGANPDGTENPKAEFVELYNAGHTTVDITGWQVDFLTKNHDGTATATRTLTTLTGIIEPASFIVISYDRFISHAHFYFSGGPASGYLAKGDGTVRVRDGQGDVVDMVGWGNPNNYLRQPAVVPGLEYSLQRCFAGTTVQDSGNNRSDFASYAPTPGIGIECLQKTPVDELDDSDTSNDPPAPAPNTSQCHTLLITELLPNPTGADAGREFIELHNPTNQSVSLQGCSLQTSANAKVFTFGADVVLQPNEYRAVYDSLTGITMPNSGGGTVWLLSPTQEIQAVTYPPNLADDTAWALFEHDWKVTHTPTPNAANHFTPHKPCPTGQERNLDSGRCVTITPAAAQPAPCKEGQERNPATNRCRAITTAAAELKPCEPHQIRNPQTNRCKSAESTNDPKPCAEGQERNPDTNRCRKAASNADTPAIYDVPAALTDDYTGLWVAGAGLAGALSYGAYEWRADIANFLRKIKDMFVAGSK